MKTKIITFATAALVAASVAVLPSCKKKEMHTNPFLEEYDTPYGIPPFDKITTADYMPALRDGIRVQREAVDSIIANSDTPTFENTVSPMRMQATYSTR